MNHNGLHNHSHRSQYVCTNANVIFMFNVQNHQSKIEVSFSACLNTFSIVLGVKKLHSFVTKCYIGFPLNFKFNERLIKIAAFCDCGSGLFWRKKHKS